MCSAVVVTLCLLVVVGNAAAGTVREKRCGNSFPAQDTTDPPISITRVTLPDFSQDMNHKLHTSQHFSQNYSGPLILDWTLNRYDGKNNIKLFVDNLTLADSTDCQDEYLEVRTVKANESLLVLRTCGVRVIRGTHFNDVDVHFKLYLQDAQNDNGVSFEYFNYDPSSTETHTGISGEVLSPNYPTLPSPISPSFHRIIVTPFQAIKLTINDYDVSNTGCVYTNAIVFANYIDKDDQKSDYICMTGQGPFFTETNWFEIRLGSNRPNVIHAGRGFKFTYEEIPLEI